MDAAGLVGQARTLKVHPSLEALVLRGYLYRGKNLGTPKAPVAVLKNWAFATPRESHRGIHDVRFLQKKMGVNRGTHVPGPIYKLPSQAIRRRSGMAPGLPMQRDADTAECGERWAETSSCGLWPLPACGRRPTGLAGEENVSLQRD